MCFSFHFTLIKREKSIHSFICHFFPFCSSCRQPKISPRYPHHFFALTTHSITLVPFVSWAIGRRFLCSFCAYCFFFFFSPFLRTPLNHNRNYNNTTYPTVHNPLSGFGPSPFSRSLLCSVVFSSCFQYVLQVWWIPITFLFHIVVRSFFVSLSVSWCTYRGFVTPSVSCLVHSPVPLTSIRPHIMIHPSVRSIPMIVVFYMDFFVLRCVAFRFFFSPALFFLSFFFLSLSLLFWSGFDFPMFSFLCVCTVFPPFSLRWPVDSSYTW